MNLSGRYQIKIGRFIEKFEKFRTFSLDVMHRYLPTMQENTCPDFYYNYGTL